MSIGIIFSTIYFRSMKNITFAAPKHTEIYRGVEQLVARRAHNPKVVGSSPAPATKEKVQFNAGHFFYSVISIISRRTRSLS